jgi:hypothetical protein
VTRYRVALWVLLGGKLLGAWGLTWDIQWHLLIGRDTFWIPPHLMMYSGVTAGFLVAVLVLALDTRDRRRGDPGALRIATRQQPRRRQLALRCRGHVSVPCSMR